VVTADEAAAALARRHAAVILMETASVGLNEALTRVIDHFAGRQEAGVIVVPADLPHVSPFEIQEAIDLISGIPAVALVQASDGGTNLMACRPAGVIEPSFGPDSFNAHCVAAVQAGVTPTVLFAPRLGLDIDRPEDLAAFMSLGSATRTHAYLSTLDLHTRLPDTRHRRRDLLSGAERRM
jgi:2-phospho-L-lactate/phosphoenolpyruvate guanylyltransferase